MATIVLIWCYINETEVNWISLGKNKKTYVAYRLTDWLVDSREFSTRVELESRTSLCFPNRRYSGQPTRVGQMGLLLCVSMFHSFLWINLYFLSQLQVERSRRKLPLPPPEGEDGEGEGLLSVVAMYDFTAKEDTDLTLRQVYTHMQTNRNTKINCRDLLIFCVVTTGGGVHHTAQARPAVVAGAGQAWVLSI